MEPNERALIEEIEEVAVLSEGDEQIANVETEPLFVSDTVSNLVNYYTKGEIYSKEEINTLIQTIPSLKIKKYDSLEDVPDEDKEEGKIILIPKDPETNNNYTEYIWTGEALEVLGNTTINLEEYTTVEEVQDYIETALSQYQFDAEVVGGELILNIGKIESSSTLMMPMLMSLSEEPDYYVKPSTGIPASDLSADLQQQLIEFHTAIQQILDDTTIEQIPKWALQAEPPLVMISRIMYDDDITLQEYLSQNLDKMERINPRGEGSFVMNPKENQTIGDYATIFGNDCMAVNYGFACGDRTEADGNYSTSFGKLTKAVGHQSMATGLGTVAWANGATARGNYPINTSAKCMDLMDIVGNGTINNRKNIYTLDKEGNGWFAKNIYVGSNSGTNKDEGSVKVATQTEIDELKEEIATLRAEIASLKSN